MVSQLTLSYLAGAMDSDGYFTIRKSTYAKRVRMDATNAVFSEKIGLHQVTLVVPELLRDTFGGSLRLAPPQTENSKPMYRWTATDTNAANACVALLPYLRIKRAQAETLLELRKTKNPQYWQLSYWFALEHPDWATLPLVTTDEAATMLGMTVASIAQSIRKGTLLATGAREWRTPAPRIPRLLIDEMNANGGASVRPPQLIAWRNELTERVREMNKIGVNGTPIYRREGHYTPK